jgi:hypothetical protein
VNPAGSVFVTVTPVADSSPMICDGQKRGVWPAAGRGLAKEAMKVRENDEPADFVQSSQ